MDRRQFIKEELVRLHKGKCFNCDYDKSPKLLEFHHINPAKKEFELSMRNITSLTRAIEESKKCILTCANCHREIELGLLKSPKESTFTNVA